MSLRVLLTTYKATFVVHVVTTVATLISLWLPDWVDTSSARIGLAQICYLRSPDMVAQDPYSHCSSFPQNCHSDDPFCALWNTAAFAMWITVVLQLASVIAYASPALGQDTYLLQTGWRIIVYFLMGTAFVQGAGISTVSKLYSVYSDRFGPGDLDGFGKSWWLGVSSCILTVTNIVILVIVGLSNKPEIEYSTFSDYVYIRDEEETEDEDESRDYYYYLQRSYLESLQSNNNNTNYTNNSNNSIS